MIHNESVNVWSHLLGVLVFIGLIFHTFHFKAPPAMQSWTGQGVGEQRQMDARRVQELMSQGLTHEQVISQAISTNNMDHHSHEEHGSLFESLETEFEHALHVLADPQLYVK